MKWKKQRGLLWLAFYSGWSSSSSRARQPAVHKTNQLLTLWCFYPERNPSWKTIILLSYQLQPGFCSVPSVNSLAGLCGDRLLCSLIQTRGQKPPVPHVQTNTRRLFRTNSLPVRNRKKSSNPERQPVLLNRWRDDVLVNYNRERSGFFTTWETVQYYIRVSNFSNT